MYARIITLKFSPALEKIDDSELQDFIKDKDVLSLREHFFVKDEMPYLAVMVTYRGLPLESGVSANKPKTPDESWKDLLREEDWPLFNSLREWRRERAKEKGFSAYVICTNRELAEVVRKRPQTLAELEQVHGFGPAKIQKYGNEMLALMAGTSVPPPQVPSDDDATVQA